MDDRPDKFSPDLFVGREPELQNLKEWATALTVPRRLKIITAPPGYGKSWLLRQLENQLNAKHGRELFLIDAPTLQLRSRADIAAWLPSIFREAKKFCYEVRTPDPANSPETIISHLLEDLSKNCSPTLRPIILVDAFDELLPNEGRELEKHLLEPFWANSTVRIVIAFRDELSLVSPTLRRGEERMRLEAFSEPEGRRQLDKRLKLKDESLRVSLEDFLDLVDPYTLNVPALNLILLRRIRQNEQANRSPLLLADDLRASWHELVGEKLTQQPFSVDTLESDLWKIVRIPETSWNLETFAEVCGYTVYKALQHIDSLITLGVVNQTRRQRYQVIDGLREILRLQLRLRFGLEIYLVPDHKPSHIPQKTSPPPPPPPSLPTLYPEKDELPKPSRKVQIFLSYVQEDKAEVENLYQRLLDAGYKSWMGSKDIRPGELWETSIRNAIKESNFFLACLSTRSVNSRGFSHKEIRLALDVLDEMPENHIYLIPVRLEDCQMPDNLGDFQPANLFEPDGFDRLLQAIEAGRNRRYGFNQD
jgi:hypothetical protein